ncbi:MAG: GWxTD domain-containing protein, partial [candidate division KSB1 bacterium]
YEKAHKLLERANRLWPKSREVLVGLGKIEVAQEKWGKADGRFDDILKRDKNDLEAHYYSGICDREIGKFKALMLRKFDFDQAEKHFDFILSRDSSFFDTVYQLALLEHLRGNEERAVEFGRIAVRLRPELSSTQVGLFRLYRYFLDGAGKEEGFRWLKNHGSEHARYFIGEKHRLLHDYPAADSIFRALMSDELQMNKQRLMLSLAKVYYAQEAGRAGEELFWRAVDSIKTKVDAALVFEDLKYIFTHEEFERYRLLTQPEEWQAFYRKLWSKRNPMPAANVNARLVEHYRRLVVAEQHYAFDGIRSRFNNPDKLSYFSFPEVYDLNHEFNDKGLVYLRHGPPDDTAFNVGQNSVPNESWRYLKTEERRELTFHFVIDNNATANNWRLTPILNDPAMLEARLQWGPVYHRLLTAQPNEIMNFENEMANETMKSVEVGFDSDRHTWNKTVAPLETPFYFATFREPAGGTRLELYYGVALAQFGNEPNAAGAGVVLEKGFALQNREWQEVHRIDRQTKLQSSPHAQIAHGMYLDLFRYTAPPDSYQVSFYARQINTTPNRLGGFNFAARAPDYSSSQLMLSDLLLAFSIAPATKEDLFARNGLRLVPNPHRNFDRKNPVSLYFEIYNLTLDKTGKSAFTLEYTVQLLEKKKSGLGKITGVFGGGTKAKISLSAEREGDTATAIETLGLDLSKADAGEFELTVVVIDRHNKKEAKATSRLWLY